MRKVVFANQEIYHVFNRSVEKIPVFNDKREYQRATIALDYYRFQNPPLKLSRALTLELKERQIFFENLRKDRKKLVDIICYCLMSNHFHFLLKQNLDGGISEFVKNFSDSYGKYFNIKNQRIGPLFQGAFKAVLIESDDQLIHVSRYIHLNPVTSFVTEKTELSSYPWSSFPEYLGQPLEICNKEIVMNFFSSKEKYKSFVYDQISYARELEKIKHLILE